MPVVATSAAFPTIPFPSSIELRHSRFKELHVQIILIREYRILHSLQFSAEGSVEDLDRVLPSGCFEPHIRVQVSWGVGVAHLISTNPRSLNCLFKQAFRSGVPRVAA
jgi:hypothetical protein